MDVETTTLAAAASISALCDLAFLCSHDARHKCALSGASAREPMLSIKEVRA